MAIFGNDTIEASTGQLSGNILGLITTSGAAGFIESISAYLTPTGTRLVKFAIYDAATDALIAQTEQISISGGAGWRTAYFTTPPAINASTSYYLVGWANGSFQCTIARASATGAGRFRGIAYSANFPDPSGTSNNPFRYSIFATYLAPPVGGNIKVFDGSDFVAKPVKVYDGADWVEKPVKVYDGADWVPTNY